MDQRFETVSNSEIFSDDLDMSMSFRLPKTCKISQTTISCSWNCISVHLIVEGNGKAYECKVSGWSLDDIVVWILEG